jgi:hypothetical protein
VALMAMAGHCCAHAAQGLSDGGVLQSIGGGVMHSDCSQQELRFMLVVLVHGPAAASGLRWDEWLLDWVVVMRVGSCPNGAADLRAAELRWPDPAEKCHHSTLPMCTE